MSVTIEDIKAQVEALDDDFQLFSANGATSHDVAAIEASLGRRLSGEHRALITTYAALAVRADPEIWPPPEEYDIRPRWQFASGIEVFGLAPNAAAIDVVAQARNYPAEGRPDLVPAMKRFGDPEVVGCAADGVLHEWRAGGEPTRIKGTLLGVLSEWLTTLAADKDRVKEDGIGEGDDD